MLHKFLVAEAVPLHTAWGKQGYIDRDLWRKAGEHSFLCPTVPEEYGGVGGDFLFNAIVDEELAKLCLSGIGWGLHSDIAVPYILNYGSEELKQKFLPGTVTGDIITAIAMTEAGTGSDLQGIKTNAVLDGDEYIINGSKTFITNGQQADLVIVVARTESKAGSKGISLFLVEAKTPGYSRGSNLEK
jgi:alkylation response protein AidB-like acyl-CoA dehydrogenase